MKNEFCYCGCFPQKAELVYLIPAIRRQLAIFLSKKMPEKEAAQKLEITKSAVSQYIHKKRGSFKLPEDLIIEIEKSAEKISENKAEWKSEMMHLLKYSKDIGCTCKVCKVLEK